MSVKQKPLDRFVLLCCFFQTMIDILERIQPKDYSAPMKGKTSYMPRKNKPSRPFVIPVSRPSNVPRIWVQFKTNKFT